MEAPIKLPLYEFMEHLDQAKDISVDGLDPFEVETYSRIGQDTLTLYWRVTPYLKGVKGNGFGLLSRLKLLSHIELGESNELVR